MSDVNLGLPLRASRHNEPGRPLRTRRFPNNRRPARNRNTRFIIPNKFLSGKKKKRKKSAQIIKLTLYSRARRNEKHKTRAANAVVELNSHCSCVSSGLDGFPLVQPTSISCEQQRTSFLPHTHAASDHRCAGSSKNKQQQIITKVKFSVLFKAALT